MNSTYPVVLLTRLTKNDLIFDEQEKWKYECTACPFRSNHITNFALHRRDHVGTLEYPCEKCDKTFTERSDMKSHYEETHNVSRLQTCAQCGKVFAGDYNLGCEQRNNCSRVRMSLNIVNKICNCSYSKKENTVRTLDTGIIDTWSLCIIIQRIHVTNATVN